MQPRQPAEKANTDNLTPRDDHILNTDRNRKNSAKSLSSVLALTAKVVFCIITISIAAASFPVQPLNPLWFLKLGEICVDYSLSLLFGLILIYLSQYFGSPRSATSGQRQLFHRLISALFIFYALLIPIQLVALGLYWQQTAQANQQIFEKAEAELGILRKRIRGSSTEEQLRSALGEGARLLPPFPGILLQDRKSKLVEAIDNRLFSLQSSLQNDRQQRLRTFFLSTAKGVSGAGLMTFAFSRMKRLQLPK